jgi:N-dimethylarginine dimethylaminohydrolase
MPMINKRSTCHSEVGSIESLFVKPAGDAFISADKIASEWKPLNYLSAPDLARANREYEVFESLLRKAGIPYHTFLPDPGLSLDSMYCRDASLATDGGMILFHMGKEARRGEEVAQQKVFLDHGIPILGRIEPPGTMEGGDVTWLDEHTLAVGLSYRTNAAGISQIRSIVSPLSVEVIEVALPHYKGPVDVFHLMSILSPVDCDLAVVYSPLMPIGFRNLLLERGYTLIEVPEDEFETMGCNVLAIAPRKCIMVKGNPDTKMQLERAGCEVWEYEGTEISLKGGGGPTCLTRPIRRSVHSAP